MSNKKASMLIMAMWILVLFSILTVGLYNIVSSQIRLTRSIQERIICPYLAKAASLYARLERKNDKTPYDTLYELTGTKELTLGSGKIAYTLEDEGSKISINSAPEDIISRLPGLNEGLARNIAKVRKDLNLFHIKEEILLAEGIDKETFLKCKDFITVYGDGRVNINTARKEVLEALGLDESVVSRIEDFRKGADNEISTEDDGYLENVGEIIDKLGLYGEQITNMLNVINRGLISVASVDFSGILQTELNGKPAMKYIIVMNRDKIKQWTEY